MEADDSTMDTNNTSKVVIFRANVYTAHQGEKKQQSLNGSESLNDTVLVGLK